MPSLRGRYVLTGLAALALALLLTASSSAASGRRAPTLRHANQRAHHVAHARPAVRPFDSPPDTSPPVTTDDADGLWHPSSETVHFAATDSQSSVAATYYRIDGGAWVKGGAVTLSVWKRGGNNGSHTIDYYSVDSAGNAERPKSCLIKLDSLPPQTSDTSDGLWHQFSETVHFTASDATSGVAAKIAQGIERMREDLVVLVADLTVGAMRLDLRQRPDQPLAAAGDHQGQLVCSQQVHDLYTAVSYPELLPQGRRPAVAKTANSTLVVCWLAARPATTSGLWEVIYWGVTVLLGTPALQPGRKKMVAAAISPRRGEPRASGGQQQTRRARLSSRARQPLASRPCVPAHRPRLYGRSQHHGL